MQQRVLFASDDGVSFEPKVFRGTVAKTVCPQPFLYENDACASRVYQILEKISIVGEKVSASGW
jgi:hypothetical protein